MWPKPSREVNPLIPERCTNFWRVDFLVDVAISSGSRLHTDATIRVKKPVIRNVQKLD